jgi:hypothetical protein
MSTPMRKGELDLGLHLSGDGIHEEEEPALGMGRKRATKEASTWLLNTSSTMIGTCAHSLTVECPLNFFEMPIFFMNATTKSV